MVVRGVFDKGFGDRGHHGNAARGLMSSNQQPAPSGPSLFVTHTQLRQYGLSSGDLRRGVPPGVMDWPLRSDVRLRLAPLLTEAGVGKRATIFVRELRNPPGFELAVLAN